MKNISRDYPGWQLLLLLLVLGGIIGSYIGQALTRLWPALGMLGKVQSIGVPKFTIDLNVFTFTFGFMMHISFFTLLGFILAYLVYRRM
ncbi:MAG: DUF4321 domain-containing protein [Deltaproteobacteria bacterium]